MFVLRYLMFVLRYLDVFVFLEAARSHLRELYFLVVCFPLKRITCLNGSKPPPGTQIHPNKAIQT